MEDIAIAQSNFIYVLSTGNEYFHSKIVKDRLQNSMMQFATLYKKKLLKIILQTWRIHTLCKMGQLHFILLFFLWFTF